MAPYSGTNVLLKSMCALVYDKIREAEPELYYLNHKDACAKFLDYFRATGQEIISKDKLRKCAQHLQSMLTNDSPTGEEWERVKDEWFEKLYGKLK